MTPRELAEKITNLVLNARWSSQFSEIEQRWVHIHLDEIESLLKAELDVTCTKCKRAHANFCDECYTGELSSALEEIRIDECTRHADAATEAKAEAYERAAKIAEESCHCPEQGFQDCDHDRPICERIRQCAREG